MSKNPDGGRCAGDERWAHFRFSVIGPLLAAPPERGDLKGQLKALAAKGWQHPITGRPLRLPQPTRF